MGKPLYLLADYLVFRPFPFGNSHAVPCTFGNEVLRLAATPSAFPHDERVFLEIPKVELTRELDDRAIFELARLLAACELPAAFLPPLDGVLALLVNRVFRSIFQIVPFHDFQNPFGTVEVIGKLVLRHVLVVHVELPALEMHEADEAEIVLPSIFGFLRRHMDGTVVFLHADECAFADELPSLELALEELVYALMRITVRSCPTHFIFLLLKT